MRGRAAADSYWFPRAFAYSIGLHLVFAASVVLVPEIEWRTAVGAPSTTPEIAVLPRNELNPLSKTRELEPETEVPTVTDVVDVVEEVPLFEPPEPLLPEPKDPLLEEDSFEELELDPLTTPQVEQFEVPEEPVGEEPEPVRELLESPSAVYPRSAALRRIEGTVLLSLTIDHAGVVIDVVLIKSSGHGSLDRAAIKAARAYRFEKGEGVLTVSKTITFRLP